MSDEKPEDKVMQRSFTRQFDIAMIETRMIDALVKADGWTLAEFASAPTWLRQVYTRHALAACEEMHNIEIAESRIKPSDHA